MRLPHPSTMSGASDADAFAYEPRPDASEQRELRREYRALLASAQNTRRHLPESSIADVGDMVRLGDELYTKGTSPTRSPQSRHRPTACSTHASC